MSVGSAAAAAVDFAPAAGSAEVPRGQFKVSGRLHWNTFELYADVKSSADEFEVVIVAIFGDRVALYRTHVRDCDACTLEEAMIIKDSIMIAKNCGPQQTALLLIFVPHTTRSDKLMQQMEDPLVSRFHAAFRGPEDDWRLVIYRYVHPYAHQYYNELPIPRTRPKKIARISVDQFRSVTLEDAEGTLHIHPKK